VICNFSVHSLTRFIPSNHVFTWLLTGVFTLVITPVWSLPAGLDVITGQVNHEYVNNNTLNIKAQSLKNIINFDSFNIGQAEQVNISMPNNASVLGRVTGGEASVIAGQLSANGSFILVNPGGILFTPSARVNVGNLFVSTLSLTNENYLNNYWNFLKEPSVAPKFIINSGKIASSENVVFIGGALVNQGVMQAKQIQLAVGDAVTVSMGHHHQVIVTVDEPLKNAVTGFNQAILNTGIVQADNVTLNAKLINHIYQHAVNNTGIIQAKTLDQQGGTIRLLASQPNELALIENIGVLDVSGYNGGLINLNGDMTHNNGLLLANGQNYGGTIQVLGNHVVIGNQSVISATGHAKGGHIRVGGDFWGQGLLRRSQSTWVGPFATLDVSNLNQGDAGTAAIWSDNHTWFSGHLWGQGGVNGGNGAFTEVSGKQQLTMLGQVNLLAPKGQRGILLLDPTDIAIIDFNPLSLNPRVWVDPRDTASLTLSGGYIQQLLDKSSFNNHLSQTDPAKQPVLAASGINGQNSIFFDGTDGLSFSAVNLGTNNSLFLIAQPQDINNPSGSVILGENSGAGGNYGLFVDNNTLYYRPAESFFNLVGVPHALVNNQNYQFGVVRQGSQVNFSQNGSPLGSAQTLASNTNLTLNSLAKYSNVDNNFLYTGHIGEVFVFDTALSSVQQSLVEQHLSANWGTSYNTPLSSLSTLTQSYLEALSQTTNISLLASNNITFGALKNGSLNLKGSASLTLDAGGTISMQANDRIRTEGGNISFTANTLSLGSLDTTGLAGNKTNGHITLTALGGNVSANTLSTAGTGNITVSAPAGTIQVNQVNVGNGTVIPASLLPPVTTLDRPLTENNSQTSVVDLPLIPNFISAYPAYNSIQPVSEPPPENPSVEPLVNVEALDILEKLEGRKNEPEKR
jgi:filamentous hemagglutinin family protein